MTKFLREKLEEKKKNLLEIYKGLEQLQKLKINDLRENIANVWAVAFGLVAGIEAVLDISQYLLSAKSIKAESYSQIPEKLKEAKIINEKFAEKLQKMLGFRNRAIHNYPSLDLEELFRVLQKDIKDFKEFLKLAS